MVRKDDKTTIETLQARLIALSALVGRANLAASMGLSFGGKRDIYDALGYPKNIKYTDYAVRYARQDIAGAVIDRPADATWDGDLELLEGEDDKDTRLEEAWRKLRDDLKLVSIFNRADKLSGIGKYAVLVLGLSDVKKVEDFALPVTKSTESKEGKSSKLLYVLPVGEGNAPVDAWEKQPDNKRYGLPKTYLIKINEPGGNTPREIKVHYTRVIHIVQNVLESDVEGYPVLEGVYNRLMDLEKLVGGSAEMFWRGARGGYQGKVDKDYTLTPEIKEDLKKQLDEYEHDLRRFLVNEGVSIESLQQQLADPKNAVDVQIQMISARTQIPKRILTGSERGELSSSQDKEEWSNYVKRRREKFAEPAIVRAFIDICMKYGILPAVGTKGGYQVQWSDLFALSDADKVKIGKDRSAAIKEYSANPMAEMIFPPDAFYQFCLGLNPEQIDLVKEMLKAFREDQLDEEEEVIEEEEQIIEETQQTIEEE